MAKNKMFKFGNGSNGKSLFKKSQGFSFGFKQKKGFGSKQISFGSQKKGLGFGFKHNQTSFGSQKKGLGSQKKGFNFGFKHNQTSFGSQKKGFNFGFNPNQTSNQTFKLNPKPIFINTNFNFGPKLKSKPKSKRLNPTPISIKTNFNFGPKSRSNSLGFNLNPKAFNLNPKPISIKVNKNTFSYSKPLMKMDEDLNWSQVKKRYPNTNPLADSDNDGVRNWLDCRPLNINMQGKKHKKKRFDLSDLTSRKELEEEISKLPKTKKELPKLGTVTRASPSGILYFNPKTGRLGKEGILTSGEIRAGLSKKGGLFSVPLGGGDKGIDKEIQKELVAGDITDPSIIRRGKKYRDLEEKYKELHPPSPKLLALREEKVVAKSFRELFNPPDKSTLAARRIVARGKHMVARGLKPGEYKRVESGRIQKILEEEEAIEREKVEAIDTALIGAIKARTPRITREASLAIMHGKLGAIEGKHIPVHQGKQIKKVIGKDIVGTGKKGLIPVDIEKARYRKGHPQAGKRIVEISKEMIGTKGTGKYSELDLDYTIFSKVGKGKVTMKDAMETLGRPLTAKEQKKIKTVEGVLDIAEESIVKVVPRRKLASKTGEEEMKKWTKSFSGKYQITKEAKAKLPGGYVPKAPISKAKKMEDAIKTLGRPLTAKEQKKIKTVEGVVKLAEKERKQSVADMYARGKLVVKETLIAPKSKIGTIAKTEKETKKEAQILGKQLTEAGIKYPETKKFLWEAFKAKIGSKKIEPQFAMSLIGGTKGLTSGLISGLTYSKYKKGILIQGATKANKVALKKAGFSWNKPLGGWVGPISSIPKLKEIGALHEQKVTVPTSTGKYTVRAKGDKKIIEKEITWEPYKKGIIVKGDTYTRKDELKEKGFTWNPNLKAWVGTKDHIKRAQELGATKATETEAPIKTTIKEKWTTDIAGKILPGVEEKPQPRKISEKQKELNKLARKYGKQVKAGVLTSKERDKALAQHKRLIEGRYELPSGEKRKTTSIITADTERIELRRKGLVIGQEDMRAREKTEAYRAIPFQRLTPIEKEKARRDVSSWRKAHPSGTALFKKSPRERGLEVKKLIVERKAQVPITKTQKALAALGVGLYGLAKRGEAITTDKLEEGDKVIGKARGLVAGEQWAMRPVTHTQKLKVYDPKTKKFKTVIRRYSTETPVHISELKEKYGKSVGTVEYRALKARGAIRRVGEEVKGFEKQLRKYTPAAPTSVKEKQRATKRAVLGTLGVLGIIQPEESRRFVRARKGEGLRGRGQRRPRGRPTGSYKYSIPGKGPVHVYDYRRWARRQRALKRLQREPEYEDFEGERIQPPQERPREEFTEDRGGYEAIQEDRGEMRAGETTQRGESSILSAKPIMERERGKSSILTAANVFNPEERARLPPMKDPVQDVDTVHKPVVNPEGDYYTDVDPLSGKPILQKRVRERWAEGE